MTTLIWKVFFFTRDSKMKYNQIGDSMLKIGIIHGPNPMDGKDMDGEITLLETEDEQEQHIVTVIDFLKTHYKDDPNLQQLKITHPIQTACYVFTHLGDIVFVDTTGANPKSHVGIGIFMMPETITEKQKDGLKKFKNKIAHYNDVRIDYNIIYDQGFFDSQTLRGTGEFAVNVIDKYLDKVVDIQKENTK